MRTSPAVLRASSSQEAGTESISMVLMSRAVRSSRARSSIPAAENTIRQPRKSQAFFRISIRPLT